MATETAREAARRLSASMILRGFQPAALHCYTERDGTPIYYRIRLKHPDSGEKWLRPMHFNGNGFKIGEPDFGQHAKPLYRLHQVAAADTARAVWWVEGEQKADAIEKLGLIATTAGGANDDENRDLEPLRGRRVIIWPDNDAPGLAHAQRVASRLREIGCPVEGIAIGPLGLSNHGDVVDWLAAHPGATASDLEALERDSDVALPSGDQVSAADHRSVELVRASDVVIAPIRWTWDGYIARGKLHIIAGSPSQGKTTIALALAATLTTGGRWPDGTKAKRGSVAIWSGEDDPDDVLVPRLAAVGADLTLVQFVRSVRETVDGAQRTLAFDPARDMDALAARLAADPPALLIIDPIVSAVSGDSHKNAEVRRGLQPLVDLARELGVAVLGITHFTKRSQGADPIERVTGSLAFGALARLVFVASKINDDGGDKRVFMRGKNNLGPDTGGFEYHLEQREVPGHTGMFASCVTWGAAIEGSARDVLADAEADPDEDRTGTDEAVDFLRDALQHGSVAKADVTRRARKLGISDKCLRRARDRLGVGTKKAGFQAGWSWFLPTEDAQDAQDAPNFCTEKVGTFGVGGHLRDAEPAEIGVADDGETL